MGAYASKVVSAGATDPAAGGTVAATGTLTAGRYTVTVTTFPSGTIAAGDLNNVQLQVGSTVIGTLLQSTTALAATASAPVTVIVPSGGATVSVTAVGNASGAAAVYNAQIVVTPEALYE